MKLRIGTRKSKLAIVQTEIVRDAILEHFPEAEIELVQMSTEGDRILDRSLDSFGGKGVFTQDLERALLSGEIDLAVHSAKDMPMELPEGLVLGAVLGREDPADVLVTRSGIPAAQLPAGSVIGTSSLRRELQIRRINPQVQIKVLRGNVPTRLEKLRGGEYDGILLAAAGLRRLGLEQPEGLHVEMMDTETFLPAPGQGILGVEIRDGDLAEVMAAINQPEAEIALHAERTYMKILNGGCNAPCAAYCRVDGDELEMNAMYAPDGKHPVYREERVKLDLETPEFVTFGTGEGLEKKDENFAEKVAKQMENNVSLENCKTDGLENQENRMMQLAEVIAARLAAQVQVKMVSLVGAGPGDAGLVTRKALECIRRADVIVYDNLISGSLLNEARLDAELIYVGKRSGAHHMKQEQINEVLARHAMTGKYVVRLKGGDPFIFGRGGEEALYLKQHGIPFEIVPGVSSCYSVPAYAGIPVTDRRYASSFHVITGHESGQKGNPVLDYETLAREEGTLVFLMGLKNLEEICGQLIAHGKPADTPAAVISCGTTARQRQAVSDLAHIAETAHAQQIPTPAICVVGDVVLLQKDLDWFGKTSPDVKMPLAGVRVLATGTRYNAEEIGQQMSSLGAETVKVSVIESVSLENTAVCQALSRLKDYNWMVFTSGNGVELFFDLLCRENIDLRQMMHLKFACIGRKTAAALKQHGFTCDFTPDNYSSTDLAEQWIPTLGTDDRVLMLRAKEGSKVLSEQLKESGIAYDDIPLYETKVDTRRREELNRVVREVDYITLSSASAARAFASLLEEKDVAPAKVIAIGPYTAQAAIKAGLKVYAEAEEYTAEGIAAAILADQRG
jgi:uroporphyrinogen III methyltransferase/synthase